MREFRVVIADKHRASRAELRLLMKSISGGSVVGEAEDALEVLCLIERRRPQLVILDAGLHLLGSPGTAARIIRSYPTVRFLMIAANANDAIVRQALKAGAIGFLRKDAEPAELQMGIEMVGRGPVSRRLTDLTHMIWTNLRARHSCIPPVERLSPRQRAILQLLSNGYRSEQIAREMRLSLHTVKVLRAQIKRALGIADLAGLVKFAIRTGLVSLED